MVRWDTKTLDHSKTGYKAGELGGLALIKNAVRQGKECVDTAAVTRTMVGELWE
jgi:hypothetical protein